MGVDGPLLHNWSEEQRYKVEALQEFLRKRSLGQLEVQR